MASAFKIKFPSLHCTTGLLQKISAVQYVALGLQGKTKSGLHVQKFSLKIVFMFLVINENRQFSR